MSYGAGAALQAAIYQHLSADPGLAALVGDAIYDALPAAGAAPPYVLIGAEAVRDRSDMSGAGAEHRIEISVFADAAGFLAAKTAAAAVSDALSGAALALERGALVSLRFATARARRVDDGAGRRIDLTFRARIDAL